MVVEMRQKGWHRVRDSIMKGSWLDQIGRQCRFSSPDWLLEDVLTLIPEWFLRPWKQSLHLLRATKCNSITQQYFYNAETAAKWHQYFKLFAFFFLQGQFLCVEVNRNKENIAMFFTNTKRGVIVKHDCMILEENSFVNLMGTHGQSALFSQLASGLVVVTIMED